MIHSNKPSLSFEVGANHLHGVLRVDQIRTDTLVQLVQHWQEPRDRDAIIEALDALSDVVHSPRAEGELDAALEQVEDAASMDSAQVEVGMHDVRRLLGELGKVAEVMGRFLSKASGITHPSMRATRKHLAANPLPEQQDRRSA
ncbi:MAG: hypothetical protein HOY75_12975 [Streptomyces sp.]|nr:hypothetical protein [Streptomyces sp.]